MSSRRKRRSRSGIPAGATTDLSQVLDALQDTTTEIAARFINDPEIGGGFPRLPGEEFEPATALPVAMFEPVKTVQMRHGNGDVSESQVETIIQQGFSRWRQMVVFNALEGWSVRQTGDGMELWDSGGLWAVGHGALGAKWLQAAEDLGHVLVVYGPRIGVRQPVSGRWDAAAKAAELRSARQSGIVAAAVVAWRGLQPPDVAPYPGPRYHPTTGEIDIGVNAGGESSTWRLLEPGVGVRHGLIVGPEGWGKTNTLRILNLGALTSKCFTLWAADPACRSDLTWMSDIADWIATGSQETVEMLRGAANVVAARLAEGGYAEPSSAKPGILLTVDDGQQVFAGNPEATRLAEVIVADGGRAGVALVVTTRGADLAYFGGSAKLRAGLAAGVVMAMGPDAYGIHDMLRADGGAD